MDGTLYDLNDLVEENFYSTVNYLVNYHNFDRQKAIDFLIDNNIYPYISNNSKSSTALFSSLGYDITIWNEYRSKVFPYKNIKIQNSVNIDTLIKFKEKAHIVLLTNNTIENINNLLNHLQIDECVFEEIVYCKDLTKHVSKFDNMKYLISKYKCKPSECLSIGDRYEVDGKPMVELGGKAIIIKKPSSLMKILQDFDNFKTCDEYEFTYENLVR